MNAYVHPGFVIEPTFQPTVPEILCDQHFDEEEHGYKQIHIETRYLYPCSQSFNICTNSIRSMLQMYPRLSQWFCAPWLALLDCIFTPLCLILDVIWNGTTGGLCLGWVVFANFFTCAEYPHKKIPLQCLYGCMVNVFNLLSLCLHGCVRKWYQNWPCSCLWSWYSIAKDPHETGNLMEFELYGRDIESLQRFMQIIPTSV